MPKVKKKYMKERVVDEIKLKKLSSSFASLRQQNEKNSDVIALRSLIKTSVKEKILEISRSDVNYDNYSHLFDKYHKTKKIFANSKTIFSFIFVIRNGKK